MEPKPSSAGPGKIDLARLPLLRDVFQFLQEGRHLNRLTDNTLWAELEREQAQYEALFQALGYRLVIEPRGYAYLHAETASARVTQTSRHLALLFMLMFEYQADRGRPLGRFLDWRVDAMMLAAIWEHNRLLLEAEGFASEEDLTKVLTQAVRQGFVVQQAQSFTLLPAVHRYLDRFLELAATRERPKDPELEQLSSSRSEAIDRDVTTNDTDSGPAG